MDDEKGFFCTSCGLEFDLSDEDIRIVSRTPHRAVILDDNGRRGCRAHYLVKTTLADLLTRAAIEEKGYDLHRKYQYNHPAEVQSAEDPTEDLLNEVMNDEEQ